MTLLDIKKAIIEQTGRLGLVKDAVADDYDDNGIMFHIQAAQRFLDRAMEYKGDKSIFFQRLTPGQVTVSFYRPRFIESVWIEADEPGNMFPVEFLSYRQFRLVYPEIDITPTGVPRYWTIPTPRLAPELADQTRTDLEEDDLTDLEYLEFADYTDPEAFHLTEKILFQPAPLVATSMQVHARWKHAPLSNDTDINFWTLEAPELLIDAARMSIEQRLHRNNEGANQFLSQVMVLLNQIHNDLISEEAAGPSEQFKVW